MHAPFITDRRCLLQVKDIKSVADYVAQLRRLGPGHGTWHFDRLLAAGGLEARTH